MRAIPKLGIPASSDKGEFWEAPSGLPVGKVRVLEMVGSPALLSICSRRVQSMKTSANTHLE